MADIEGWFNDYRSNIAITGRRDAIQKVGREYLRVYEAAGIVS